MVNGLMPSYHSSWYEESLEDAEEYDKRLWWCPECGAVWHRHHFENEYKFCKNCDDRDAVHIEMKPVGPGKEQIGK